MQISSDTLVRDFVTEYDEIRSQVDSVLMGAMIESTEWKGDIAEVTVSVPAMEVWAVVGPQWKIVNRGKLERTLFKCSM